MTTGDKKDDKKPEPRRVPAMCNPDLYKRAIAGPVEAPPKEDD